MKPEWKDNLLSRGHIYFFFGNARCPGQLPFHMLTRGVMTFQEYLFAMKIEPKILSLRPRTLHELLGVEDIYFIRTNV